MPVVLCATPALRVAPFARLGSAWAVLGVLMLGVLTQARTAAAQSERAEPRAPVGELGTAQPERPAAGASEPRAPRGKLVAPRPLSARSSYPPGGKGDARVLLKLLVRADGTVQKVEVLSGQEPFRSAALQAAAKWRFKPATRDGKAVPGLIQFEVAFTDKPRRGPGPDDEPRAAQPSAPPDSQPATEQAPLEVVVRGRRQSADTVTVSRAEARQIPGTFGDPTRAVEALPGVTPVMSGVPYFYVRGAPPGNIGYFIDGVRVPQLYHIFVGPSVIHPSMIDRVQLHRGGYPAQFGRYNGAVVAAYTAHPCGRPRAEGVVRVFDAGALVEAPFAGGEGSALVGGRYSYTGLILSLLSDTELKYWDYQSLVAYEVGARDTLSVLTFGAFDRLASASEEERTGAEFHRVDLRWDSRPSARTDTRLALTLGADRTESEQGFVRDRSVAVRTELAHRMPQVTLRAGTDTIFDRYTLEMDRNAPSYPDLQALLPTRDDLVVGAYSELEIEPEPWLVVTPGLRTDLFTSAGRAAVGVDPRISAVFHVSERVRLSHAFGIVHQSPNFVPGIPGAQVGSLRGGLQRSAQASAGVEVQLPASVTAGASVFRNAFFNLSDPIGTSADLRADQATANIRGLGSSAGVELLLRRSLTRKLGGFAAYTLSRTERSYGSFSSLSAFDRTHVLQTALGYDFGRHWRAGARSIVMSGVPARVLTENGPRFDGDRRARPFYRLDLRLEKRFVVSKRAWWAVVAEVLNATLSKEVIRRTCGNARCIDTETGPVTMPSLGLEGAF
jgi:TonB family protein